MARRHGLPARGAGTRSDDSSPSVVRGRRAARFRRSAGGGARDVAHQRSGRPGAAGPRGAVTLALGIGRLGEPDLQLEVAGHRLFFPASVRGYCDAPRPDRAVQQLRRTLQRDQSNSVWVALKRVRAAGAQADGSRAERGVTVEASVLTAAIAYVRAVRAQAVVAARQADSGLAAELVGLAEAQRAAGVSPAIDVTRAQAQLATARGLLLVAKNLLDRGRIDVTRALGLDPATPLAFSDSLAPSLGAADVPAQRDSGLAAALANRPELRAELARAAAARQTGSAIRAERLPRLELAGDYGVNGKTVPKAIATRDLALQVSVPILDGFRREARLDEQDAVVRESQVREADLRRQIAAEVDAALLDLGSAEAQQLVAREQLRLAESELSQARERFKAGVAGNIDVITAQAGLIRARDTEIDARFAAATARISLARAAGVARTLH